MIPETTIFNFKTLNSVKVIVIFLLISKIKFLWQREYQKEKWKNRAKTGRILNFPGP